MTSIICELAERKGFHGYVDFQRLLLLCSSLSLRFSQFARSRSSLLSNKSKMLTSQTTTVPGHNGNFDDSFYKVRSNRVERSTDFGIVWSMGQS